MYPESIARVQDLTGKTVTFYEADITNKDRTCYLQTMELFENLQR